MHRRGRWQQGRRERRRHVTFSGVGFIITLPCLGCMAALGNDGKEDVRKEATLGGARIATVTVVPGCANSNSNPRNRRQPPVALFSALLPNYPASDAIMAQPPPVAGLLLSVVEKAELQELQTLFDSNGRQATAMGQNLFNRMYELAVRDSPSIASAPSVPSIIGQIPPGAEPTSEQNRLIQARYQSGADGEAFQRWKQAQQQYDPLPRPGQANPSPSFQSMGPTTVQSPLLYSPHYPRLRETPAQMSRFANADTDAHTNQHKLALEAQQEYNELLGEHQAALDKWAEHSRAKAEWETRTLQIRVRMGALLLRNNSGGRLDGQAQGQSGALDESTPGQRRTRRGNRKGKGVATAETMAAPDFCNYNQTMDAPTMCPLPQRSPSARRLKMWIAPSRANILHAADSALDAMSLRQRIIAAATRKQSSAVRLPAVDCHGSSCDMNQAGTRHVNPRILPSSPTSLVIAIPGTLGHVHCGSSFQNPSCAATSQVSLPLMAAAAASTAPGFAVTCFNSVSIEDGKASGQIRYKGWQQREMYRHIARHGLTKNTSLTSFGELEERLELDLLDSTLKSHVSQSVVRSLKDKMRKMEKDGIKGGNGRTTVVPQRPAPAPPARGEDAKVSTAAPGTNLIDLTKDGGTLPHDEATRDIDMTDAPPLPVSSPNTIRVCAELEAYRRTQAAEEARLRGLMQAREAARAELRRAPEDQQRHAREAHDADQYRAYEAAEQQSVQVAHRQALEAIQQRAHEAEQRLAFEVKQRQAREAHDAGQRQAREAAQRQAYEASQRQAHEDSQRQAREAHETSQRQAREAHDVGRHEAAEAAQQQARQLVNRRIAREMEERLARETLEMKEPPCLRIRATSYARGP
ncbi:hypothetical protein G7046_g10056 [Stylonectria norvegica]|nr:hypothetical protein G7046_g10056 [Stylonectria norvegica]